MSYTFSANNNPTPTVADLHAKIVAREISIADLVAGYVARAKSDTHNAMREVFSDIDEQVARAQAMLDGGTSTLLTGIPVITKDNILFAGHHAGASSKILEAYVASYDSTAVRKLKEAGAVIIGRANMDEFAMGSSTENSAYGVTQNPIDPTKVPGGSSGGSAAAVAADLCVVALGSDTGGSIRQPAAFCGIVGLLPTYGSVSRHGLMAMGSSLDVIGPMTRTVADAEALYAVLAQTERDAFDGTSGDASGIAVASPSGAAPLKKKLAVPKGIFANGGCDAAVEQNFAELVEKFKAQGFAVEEVELTHFADSLAVYYILMPAEVSSNLARFDGVRYGTRVGDHGIADFYGATRGALFGKEVRRRILLGTYVLSHGYYDAYYNKAVALREVIRAELSAVLAEYDAILTPTTPSPAFGIGEKVSDPVAMYLSDLFTVPANIAHLPALSVPSGFAPAANANTSTNAGADAAAPSATPLPLGVQFIGAAHAEPTLFALGKIVESVR